MSPVQIFWGSHSDVPKHAILLGWHTHSVNEQFPIFQTTHCLRVQGAKQSKAALNITTFCDVTLYCCTSRFWCSRGMQFLSFRVKQHDLLELLTQRLLKMKTQRPERPNALNNTASHPGRLVPSAAPVWEPQISYLQNHDVPSGHSPPSLSKDNPTALHWQCMNQHSQHVNILIIQPQNSVATPCNCTINQAPQSITGFLESVHHLNSKHNTAFHRTVHPPHTQTPKRVAAFTCKDSQFPLTVFHLEC